MSQTSRADLLRGIACGTGGGLVIEDDGVHRWGYALKPKVVDAMSSLPVEVGALPSDDESTAVASARLPLRMPDAWVFDLLDAGDVEERIDAATPLPLTELEPVTTDPAPYQDLVTWARVLPGLRRHSDVDADVGIDWPRLMDRLARCELPPRWPRQCRRRWADPVLLVLDCSPRLAPFRHDFHMLAQRVQALLPDSSLRVRTIVHGPTAGWRAWRNPRRPTASVVSRLHSGPQAWRVPTGATVLVASDLGAFEDAGDVSVQEQWLAWAKDLRRQGAHLVGLAPVGSGALSPALLASCTVVRWSPDSRWKRERASGQAPTAEAERAVRCLLALASTALRVDPPLLRAWCRLVDPAGDVGLEGRFWNHPDVVPHALSCALRAERVDEHLRAYAGLPAGLRDAAHRACGLDHAHLRRSLSVAEDLRHATAEASGAADPVCQTIKQLLHRARDMATLSSVDRRALLQAAQLIQSTAVDRVRALDPALFAALDGFVASDGGQRPASAAVRATHWQWVQQGARIFLDPVQHVRPGQRLAPPFELRTPADQVWALVGEVVYQRPLPSDGLALPMAWLSAGSVELGVGPWHWQVRAVPPPVWVEGAETRDGQLILSHTAPDGQRIEWPAADDLALVVLSSRLSMGTDARGLYADLTLSGRRPVSFRVRYIPPGRFRMGSPEGVGDGDEHPQHEVLLTEGYWLADTPCTQALWTAVMGENPSEFQQQPGAGNHPVENVSWDDVETFLQRLAPLLPAGCQPALPTEAQWEYAARAGTTTAYWWGDEPDDQRANWKQQHKRTTPVDRYPPNPWGLHDVHGNVWEWCLDHRGGYASEPVRNPCGDLGASERAVRGGSWIHHPDFARSAFRSGGHRDPRSLYQGFRVSLRSPSPVPVSGAVGPGQGGGSGGPATGAAGRPGAGGALLDRLTEGLSSMLGGRFGLGKRKKK